MWYIYIDNDNVAFSRIKPSEEYFVIDKLPPKPNKRFLELKADFGEQIVWWGERPLSQEGKKEKRINDIKEELTELDKKIDRTVEDIIEELHKQTGYMPYATTIEVINRKEDLRDELKELDN